MNIQLVFLILALLCFIADAAKIPTRINLTATGLALWVASIIIHGK